MNDMSDVLGSIEAGAHAMIEVVAASLVVVLLVALVTSLRGVSPAARQRCWSAATLFPLVAFAAALAALIFVHEAPPHPSPRTTAPVVDPLEYAFVSGHLPVSPRSMLAAGGGQPVLTAVPSLRRLEASVSWIGIAAVIWLAVVLLGLVRIAWGVRRAHRIARRAAYDPPFASIEASQRRIVVRSTSATNAPIAVGLIHRTVLLPRSFLEAIQPEDVRAVTAHEIAHLVRRDDWTDVFERCACAIMWVNPFVHIAAAASRVWRERACDAWAAERVGTRPFAEALFRSASALAGVRPRESALALSMGGSLAARVGAMVRPVPVSRVRTRAAMAALLTIAVVATGALAVRALVFSPYHMRTIITGAMHDARAEFATAELNDGRILVAGGVGRDHRYLSGAEVYDPATGAFTLAGSLPEATAGAVAVTLADGRVLIVGGFTAHGPTATAALFDPRTARFTGLPAMRAPRTGHSATLLRDGSVLIAGGASVGHTANRSAELFSPRRRAFISTGGLNVARFGHSATMLGDGRVLIAGGRSGALTLASSEIYDVVRRRFVSGPAMRTPRARHGAILLLDGSVLVAGGSRTGEWSGRLGSTERYIPAIGRFVPDGTMSMRRFDVGHGMILLPNGNVMVAGGADEFEMYHHHVHSFTLIDGTGGSLHPFGAIALLKTCAVFSAGGLDATVPSGVTNAALRIQ